ncbi:OmpA family protein [Marinobacter persicus]|uniref:OmpA family protein n=2 Tax=Marinobacter persicus TaxID=930118 RepID=A0A1I3NZ24_9GAMM|nr:OmpA family protein [Marinobacter persicus]
MANGFRPSLRYRLRHGWAVLCGTALLPVMIGPVQASSYGAGIENSQWYLSESIFECSLVHDVPGYGRAVFRHRAGEQLSFYLESDTPVMRPGQGRLVVEAPAWRPGVAPRAIGAVNVSGDRRTVRLGNREAMAVVQGLLDGMRPTLSRQSRYQDRPVRVQLSNVNFAGPWAGYRECTSTLLPVNYDQVRRSRIPFASASSRLSRADREWLDKVATFVLADPAIERVFVDGHSDSIGSRIDNRALSEERAQAVADYLEAQGVDPDMMTVRAHADQYPASRRAADNRRVTIRLQREGERPAFQQANAGGEDFSG